LQVEGDEEFEESAPAPGGQQRRGELDAEVDDVLDEDDPLYSMTKTQAR
jgi:hypothetical protein